MTDSDTLAPTLSQIKSGVLASLVLQKKGVVRGGKFYDNDKVHVLVWTGFDYGGLIRVSDQLLQSLEKSGTLISGILETAEKRGYSNVSREDAYKAAEEVRESFRRAMNGSSRDADREPVFEPLVIKGKRVPGCKVYRKEGDEKDGTIYLDGIKVGEKVLEAAPNGHWKTASSGKTLAKKVLQGMLPYGKYVSYRLAADTEILVGDEAVATAEKAGITLSAAMLQHILKLSK